MNQVSPDDWDGFFRERIDAVHAAPPVGGLTAAGWRLVYNDTPGRGVSPAAGGAATGGRAGRGNAGGRGRG